MRIPIKTWPRWHEGTIAVAALFVLLLLILLLGPARSDFKHPAPHDPVSLGITCDTVRLAFEAMTREHLEALALTYGVTAKQRADALKCVHPRFKRT